MATRDLVIRVAAGTYYDLTVNDGDTLGGDVTVTNTLYLNGRLNTGSNTLTLNCNATVVGAGPSSYVVGNLARNFCGVGAKTFDVGTANGYSPVDANVTAGIGNSLTVKAVQGRHPNIYTSNALARYWTISNSGSVTANLHARPLCLIPARRLGRKMSVGDPAYLRKTHATFAQLLRRHGRVVGTVLPRPKLIPLVGRKR